MSNSKAQTARKVEDAIDELRAARVEAAVNLEDVPRQVRPSRSMSKQRAQEAIPGLVAEVVTATVPARLVGVFASGDADAVAAASAFLQENGGIVLDAAKLYRGITEYIEPSYGDRVFRTTQYVRLTSALREVGDTLGLKLQAMPDYVEKICPTAADTEAHSRNLIRAALGDEVNLQSLRRAIVDAVVERDITSKRVPVLVLNADEGERAGLSPLFSKVGEYVFEPGFVAEKDAVISIFKGK